MSITCPERQRGFGVIAAIVILVILSALGAFVVSLSTSQNITLAQDVQGARAYQAANAGIEWGISHWINNNACPAASPPAAIPGIDGFALTITMTPSSGGGANFCTIEVTARTGTLGTLSYVERTLRTVAEGVPVSSCLAWGVVGTTYTVGTVVTHNAQTWTAIQTHTYFGDPSWAPGLAPALWAAGGACP